MDKEKIEKIFKNRSGNIIGNYKKSAVMILLYEEDKDISIVFEERAHFLRHQPGDICLPGGRVEGGESPLQTAIRETKEELNLTDDDFCVIGEMDYLVTPYENIMYPFVGVLKRKEITPNTEEVHHAFKVPLKYFMENEPLCYVMNIGPHLTEDFPYHLIKGGRDYKFSRGKMNQIFYKYENYVIWGFTAMIIRSFIQIIKNSST